MSTENAPKRPTKRGDITLEIAFDLLEGYIEAAPDGLRSLADPGAQVDEQDWQAKEVLGHLIDTAGNYQQRLVRAQLEPLLSFPGFDPKQWVAVQRYAERPWEELVTLWTALNRHLLHTARGIGPEHLAKPCLIGHDKPCTVEWLIIDYTGHVRHQLRRLGVIPPA